MKRFVIHIVLAALLLSPMPQYAMGKGAVKQYESAQQDKTIPTLSIVDNTIHIKNARQGCIMEIYNILGVKIDTMTIDTTEKSITLNLPKGYYIVKLDNTVRKIVIR